MLIKSLRTIISRTKRKIILAYYLFYCADAVKYLRLMGVKIGHGCSIYTDPKNFGSEPWLIEIGNNVTLGYGAMFITHDGTSRLFRDRLKESSVFGNRFGTILIRDNCFIGNNAILLPGIEIGPDSAIGAGSVVTKTVPPRMIAAGNPARSIKTLDKYIKSYLHRMIPIEATDRDTLRKELTVKLWGQER
jgi:acetyltransferase-like isoleucine patch superfamily enzyme